LNGLSGIGSTSREICSVTLSSFSALQERLGLDLVELGLRDRAVVEQWRAARQGEAIDMSTSHIGFRRVVRPSR
jgi:hypothetical protein